MKDDLLVPGVSVKDMDKIRHYYGRFIAYMEEKHRLRISRQMKEEKWLMPHIRPGCRVDYGVGRILFAGEAAGFLNPMGEGISAGMESGYRAASAALWGEWLACSGRWSDKVSRKASQGSPADFSEQHGGWMSSPSKKPAPQSHMASSTGMMLRPNGVREYSVLGGLSGMTSRCSIPHSSRLCNCCDSILGVAFGIMRCSSM